MSASSEPNTGPTGADAIITERLGEHLLLIRINRPHRRNAFDGATARAMEAALDAYDDDISLRCAIVTGSDIVFSSGQDLIAAAKGDMGTAPKRGGFGIMAVPPTKPIIADWDDADGWTNQMAFAGPVMRSEDLQEGLRAFAEKRDPVWKGR